MKPSAKIAPQSSSPALAVAAVLLGIAINLVVNGYQFGQSNHSVYLIDALRKCDPTLLANDWFYTQTLQYHSAFGWLTAALLKAGILQPAFAVLYGVLLVAFHMSWRSIVRRLGGGDDAYVLSVILYFISAGGIGLGTYQFFQDSCLLASNIANVAMFGGVAAFVSGRWILAGVGMGLAGLFHLNHAVVVPVLWIAMCLYDNRLDAKRWLRPTIIIATLIAAIGCGVNVIPSAVAKMGHPGAAIPLAEFVNVYAMLRHPHHYHPASWPFVIWLAFGFWILPGLAGIVVVRSPARDRAVVVLLPIMLLQLIALCFAGIIYVNATLVQMSLFRFSIIAHVLLVIFAAVLMTRWRAMVWTLPACLLFAAVVLALSPFTAIAQQRLGQVIMLVILGFAPMILVIARNRPWMALAGGVVALAVLASSFDRLTGLSRPLVKIDTDYRALCAWAANEENTPRDAVFLVSPVDEDFRWYARRAIVINWKSVPQLAGELPEWQSRMAATMGWTNLDALPRGSYLNAQTAMRERYDQTPADALFAAAAKYGARYVVVTRDLGADFRRRQIGPAFGRYLLYDVTR